MSEKMELFLESILPTNRSLEDYVDWPKIQKNIENIEIDLNTLDYLVKPKNETELYKRVETLFNRHGKEIFNSFEILIAKRNDKNVGRYFYDPNKNISKEYKIDTIKDINEFIHNTQLINLFQNVTNLKDYVFGVEVGLDTNARKSRTGKFNENVLRMMLLKANVKFYEQKKLNDYISPINITKKIDFIIEKNNKRYFIETSFYNAQGSKINETLKSYVDLNTNFDNKDNIFIWVVDGRGITTIKKQLEEKWDQLTIMSIKQFNNFINNI